MVAVGPKKHYDDCPICRAQKKADEEGRQLTAVEYYLACEQVKSTGQGISFIDPDFRAQMEKTLRNMFLDKKPQ